MHAVYDDLERQSEGAIQAWYLKAFYDAGLDNIRRRGARLQKYMAEVLEAHPEAKDWTFGTVPPAA